MILECPLCGAEHVTAILTFEASPIHHVRKGVQPAGPEDFAPLEIVVCVRCGHMFNRAFDAGLAARMYEGDVLSNVPVHVSMSNSLQEIANWIGPNRYAGKDAIEIGAGSGHLARILARQARSVSVFEPCKGLRAEMLPEGNIQLHPRPFTSEAHVAPVDFVVCRQVIEHVADPSALLKAIRKIVRPSGVLYLEIPRAEYIEEHTALFDLHNAHVHYFHERHVLDLAQDTGWKIEAQWRLKNGHDFGVLLRPREGPASGGISHLPFIARKLKERIDRRLAGVRRILTRLRDPVALYGATWHGVSFLNAFQSERRFEVVFDDNEDYAGCLMRSQAQSLAVVKPSVSGLAGINSIVITAYLHDRVIEDGLRSMNFPGAILSARTIGQPVDSVP